LYILILSAFVYQLYFCSLSHFYNIGDKTFRRIDRQKRSQRSAFISGCLIQGPDKIFFRFCRSADVHAVDSREDSQ